MSSESSTASDVIDAPQPKSVDWLKVSLVLAALGMGGFAIGVTEFAAMSVLPDFAAGLGVDEPTAGHAISAYAAGVVVGLSLIHI